MARPRKPTSVLELSGAFKKDPQRKRANEPKELRALGDPPDRLPAEAIPFWNELIAIAPRGVLTIADRWAVELAATLMAKATRDCPSVEQVVELLKYDELLTDDLKKLLHRQAISAAELATLRSLLAALGMTPADRSKLSVPTEKPKNPFADLVQESQALRNRPN